ncbi:DNA-directed DNA polymerase [Malassezia vespertilionis]|uniref:DNA-directed DNA polymerase n=1 Tax=Malassezia vespertilionis TaxID=2020962 RepID=UPI0024B1634E|nr:DNA-directed DNA polymerase [Malassezia vespertilionis]WFD05061.1 DNA-directed DNA polymerase [Malassezia vespertilionis]
MLGIYILPQRVDDYERVVNRIRQLGAVHCEAKEDANILLTALRAPRRIEAHTSEDDRLHKPILAVAWLDACADAGINVDLRPFAVYPLSDAYSHAQKRESFLQSAGACVPTTPWFKRARLAFPQTPLTPVVHGTLDPPDELDDREAWRHAPPWTNTEYAIFRPTPLQSALHQPLVDTLQLLRQHRRLTNDAHSEMAYMRAAAAVKAVPFALEPMPVEQLVQVKGIGAKMAGLIRQFYTLGTIAEADTIRADAAIQTMLAFTSLYGIGPKLAEKAYNEGCRTLQDLTSRKKTALAAHLGPRESLALLPDLSQSIPREEAEAIATHVVALLRTFLSHVQYTIAGSFRRGAPQSNDVDLVATYDASELQTPAQILHTLVDVLRAVPCITHIVSVARRKGESDNVHVAQLVYRTKPTTLHRRLDIVMARRMQYGAALLGWTGSVLFERDLRRWARLQGYNVRTHKLTQFSATGLVRLADHVLMDTPTEASIFAILHLPRIPPRLRNAD